MGKRIAVLLPLIIPLGLAATQHEAHAISLQLRAKVKQLRAQRAEATRQKLESVTADKGLRNELYRGYRDAYSGRYRSEAIVFGRGLGHERLILDGSGPRSENAASGYGGSAAVKVRSLLYKFTGGRLGRQLDFEGRWKKVTPETIDAGVAAFKAGKRIPIDWGELRKAERLEARSLGKASALLGQHPGYAATGRKAVELSTDDKARMREIAGQRPSQAPIETLRSWESAKAPTEPPPAKTHFDKPVVSLGAKVRTLSALLRLQNNAELRAALKASGNRIVLAEHARQIGESDPVVINGRTWRRPLMSFDQIVLTPEGVIWERRDDQHRITHELLGQEASAEQKIQSFFSEKIDFGNIELLFAHGALSVQDRPEAMLARVAAFLKDPQARTPNVIERHAQDRHERLRVYHNAGAGDVPWTKDELASYQKGGADSDPGYVRRYYGRGHSIYVRKQDPNYQNLPTSPNGYPIPREPERRREPVTARAQAPSAPANEPSLLGKVAKTAAIMGAGYVAGELIEGAVDRLIE